MRRKNMQKEIEKYRGKIFYLEERKDRYENILTPAIKPAAWINSTKDYDHSIFELHHVVPFTDWELNTKDVQTKENNALILIRKIMHQHLENPEYRLSKENFEKTYKINPDIILFDINSKLPRTAELFTKNTEDERLSNNDLSCFDEIDNDYTKILGLGLEHIFVDDCGVHSV